MLDFFTYIFIKNFDKIVSLSLLLSSGIYLRFLLQIFGQAWIKTKAHTATLLVLPIITFVITNVISGNIALSLGMVGALSIVRFRNPVRSPLELSVYFGAITMGIAASVSLQWLIFLIFSISVAVMLMLILDYLSKKIFKRPLFIPSFSEGNSLSTLTIEINDSVNFLELSSMLQSKVMSAGSVTYMLASSDFSKLKKIEENNEIQKKAKSIELKR